MLYVFKNKSLTMGGLLSLVGILAFGLFLLIFLLLKSPASTGVSDEIKSITQAIRKHYQKQIDYRGLNTASAIKENIIPLQMIRSNKVFSKNSSEILIGSDIEGNIISPFVNTFSVVYKNLNKQKCQNVLLTTFDETSGLLSITVSNKEIYEFTYGGDMTLPISKEAAKKYCTVKNDVMFTFE